MPIYEYKCKKCHHEFEELVSIHQDSPLPCPKCGTVDTQKKLSLIGGFTMGARKDSAPAASCPSGSSCASGSCPMAGGG